MTQTFKNILIIRTDRIGDVVLTTPSIKAVRKAYPDARLCVLLAPLTYDLLNGIGFVDRLFVDDRRGEHAGNLGFFKLVRKIRRERFDLVINYHTKKRTNLMAFLAGVPYRLGYRNNKWGFLLNHPVEDYRHEGLKHEAAYCLDLLNEIGISDAELTPEIALLDESVAWVDDFLGLNQIDAGDKLIVIHPSASDPAKQWPAENFVELINTLGTRNAELKFAVIGTAANRSLAASIVKGTRPKVLDTTGLLSLSQMVALLKRADLLISNDSGPVHVAAALQTPVISIFTRNQPGINPTRWQPLGERSAYVSVDADHSKSFKKAQNYDPKSMQPIAVQTVLQAVDALCKLC